jgi:hypothetical protein
MQVRALVVQISDIVDPQTLCAAVQSRVGLAISA